MSTLAKEPIFGELRGCEWMWRWRAFQLLSVTTIQPAFETERLRLRPFVLGDAPVLQRLAGRREIADTTIAIPHPYSLKMAEEWICEQACWVIGGKSVVFAVERKADVQLVGAVGLRNIDREHAQAEMGFWVGVEWWGKGYASEAARGALCFGFGQLGLNRIYAHHMVRNPASGRVLERIGMRREGLLRQRVRKWGVFEDVVLLAILRADWVGDAAAERHGSAPAAVRAGEDASPRL